MVVQVSYPGVYVDEVPSGVRTITGVATSVTAFVGRALRGPENTPLTITSYGDFERNYGGLWLDSSLGYAVRDFYRQGGSVAVIVRVHKTAPDDTATLTFGTPGANETLVLSAASPGMWGAKLTGVIDNEVGDPTDASLFNLSITDTGTGRVESFRNVSIAPTSPRRVDLVLKQESTLVRLTTLPSAARPLTPLYSLGAVVAGGVNDGSPLTQADYVGAGFDDEKKGLYALDKTDLVNLLVIPPLMTAGVTTDLPSAVLTDALTYAGDRRAILIMDPFDWVSRDDAVDGAKAPGFTSSKNAAVYFPRIRQPDPLRDGQLGTFAPAGAVAGVIARTDATRGVWKAPAGLDATLEGVADLEVPLNDMDIGFLNPLGVNCLRSAPGAGHVVWGARTRAGADRLASEWKYLPVRRTALFLEESLYRGTQWVVFEPNDEPLWASVRLNVGAFMNNLFRQGAFAGRTAREAYLVKCDKETTTQDDVNLGIVNIIVGFAPLKPAEFVIVKLQQLAGQAGGA